VAESLAGLGMKPRGKVGGKGGRGNGQVTGARRGAVPLFYAFRRLWLIN